MQEIDSAIEEIVEPYSDHDRVSLGKQFGRVTVVIDGKTMVHDRPKRVVWDSDLLDEALTQLELDGEDTSFVKVTLSVPEREYNKLSHDVRAMIDGARTVVPGKVNIFEQESKDD